jgi:hypothetical protein
MFAIIPYYFRYKDNISPGIKTIFIQECLTITPLIGQVGVMVWLAQVDQGNNHYGFSLPLVMYECKTKNA